MAHVHEGSALDLCRNLLWTPGGGGGSSGRPGSWSGISRGAPSGSSAEEMLESSLGAALRPRSTQGRCEGQSGLVVLALRVSFSWQWVSPPFHWPKDGIVGGERV